MPVTAFNIATETQVNELLYEYKKTNIDRKIYGVSWDKGESPTLTRTDSAVDLTAAVGIDGASAVNSFDNLRLWQFEEVVDLYNNVYIRIRKGYVHKPEGSNYKKVRVSEYRHPGFYLPWCFWDETNRKELPYIDVGKYVASLSANNTKLESKLGTFPLINKNIVQMRTLAQANGAGYQQLDIHVVDYLTSLFTIEFATLNSQAIMKGFSDGKYDATHVAAASETAVNRIIVATATASHYRVGQPIGIGTLLGGNQIAQYRVITSINDYDASNKAISFDGAAVNVTAGNILYNMAWKNGFSQNIVASSGALTANDGKYPMVYRGIENLYGNVWQFVDGVNINDKQAWVCTNATQYASNVFASPYKQLSYVNEATDGYIVALGSDPNNPFAQFPVAVTATNGDSKYYCDYYYQAVGPRIALVGGSWSFAVANGIRFWDLDYDASKIDVRFSARLVRKAA